MIKSVSISFTDASLLSFPRKRESIIFIILLSMAYYVYILASKRNGTLYIGFTNNLARRVFEHRNDMIEGFTKNYGVHRLVYYEVFGEASAAITREKRLKKWNRAWKLKLIESFNPKWRDLYDEII